MFGNVQKQLNCECLLSSVHGGFWVFAMANNQLSEQLIQYLEFAEKNVLKGYTQHKIKRIFLVVWTDISVNRDRVNDHKHCIELWTMLSKSFS